LRREKFLDSLVREAEIRYGLQAIKNDKTGKERTMTFIETLAKKYDVKPQEAESDYYGYAWGLGDIKSTDPGDKDVGRIMDIVEKSSGSKQKMLDLCKRMAKSITKPDKAARRAAAALQELPKDIAEEGAMLFMEKFQNKAG